MHNRSFPLAEIKIKPKNLETPWFSKRLKKPSKTKQRPYINFLKNKTFILKKNVKAIKVFLKSVK